MNFYFMIPSVYFSPVMFISGELFKEGPVRVCYRTQSMHSNKEGILLLFVCMSVTRAFLDTLARMVSLKKWKYTTRRSSAECAILDSNHEKAWDRKEEDKGEHKRKRAWLEAENDRKDRHLIMIKRVWQADSHGGARPMQDHIGHL